MSLASQQHRSRLAPVRPGGGADWDQGFAFAAVLPLRNRPVVLRLHLTDSSRRPGRCIAHAIVPLAHLMTVEGQGASPGQVHMERRLSGVCTQQVHDRL